MPDLRVLVVGLGAEPEPFVLRTLDALAESGASVSVATRSPVWRLGPLRPRQELSARAVTAAFDLIYLPWINTAVERPALFDLGVPVAVSCRGSFVSVAPWNPRRAAFRDGLATVFGRAAGVHCVSRSMQRDAESLGLDPDRATVVYTGVDTTSYRPGPHPGDSLGAGGDELRIVWIGGLNWKKDIEHALLAVAHLARSGRRTSMSIVGSGPEGDRARFTRDDLGLGSEIRFLGQVDQQALPAIHRDHDVLLHTSSTEGVPNVVVEAMASGLPVVVTDAGGTGEAVDDGVEGFLVPVRSHERMAERLCTLADDHALRRQMGEAGRRRALRQFDLRRHVADFRAFLDQAARAPAGAAPIGVTAAPRGARSWRRWS